jgi:hypothetical protein
MPTLSDDELAATRVAYDSAETLVRFGASLPSRSLLLMLVTKFRDDRGEALGAARDPLPTRPSAHLPIGELTSIELDTVAGAVGILLQDRVKRLMDDPALPRMLDQFRALLDAERTERTQIRAELAS